MNIIESIGRTPLVELTKLTEDCGARIFLKSEFFNPLASVKDRIGAAMIAAADLQRCRRDGSWIHRPVENNPSRAGGIRCGGALRWYYVGNLQLCGNIAAEQQDAAE